MAADARSGDGGEEEEAVLNAPDIDDDGTINVERYTLPPADGITDPYLRAVWAEAEKAFPGGEMGVNSGDDDQPTG